MDKYNRDKEGRFAPKGTGDQTGGKTVDAAGYRIGQNHNGKWGNVDTDEWFESKEEALADAYDKASKNAHTAGDRKNMEALREMWKKMGKPRGSEFEKGFSKGLGLQDDDNERKSLQSIVDDWASEGFTEGNSFGSGWGKGVFHQKSIDTVLPSAEEIGSGVKISFDFGSASKKKSLDALNAKLKPLGLVATADYMEDDSGNDYITIKADGSALGNEDSKTQGADRNNGIRKFTPTKETIWNDPKHPLYGIFPEDQSEEYLKGSIAEMEKYLAMPRLPKYVESTKEELKKRIAREKKALEYIRSFGK